ncbi:cytochrome c biogenesis heme-transporting ATPase CcmA [endosymbiont of Ridgeia piscesae]|uniref:Heme ABC exporter, ATP-binding protein CcmA n=1 Tax=endosymbiont of Ridgeia piscesae TaxID=54398 RepID=A0A0T5Z6N1_9GAMM|nr:cytochrome c biogenesis heme-transporting ATPase CcmA [endosymbiont of Ridgeia piscesae]KRT56400.1 heme ABC exporter, ATP-binding protein CcmA [endosymbiont of Ridgeia piscesae]KRT58578.1 heme exporter protein A [endosymbiont of Ridgeia piscesae]
MTSSAPNPIATPVFEARSLECIRDDRVLFEGLSFCVNPGQALILEGRNGSGKTSLLRILCGIRLPESGQLLWQGEDIFKLGPEFHEHISYLGHKDGSKLDLSPLENLRIARGLGKAKEGISLEDALDQVGLYGFEDVPTRNMSAGQQRRLAIARLLVTEAKLWILDEPFTSLDRKGIEHMERLFENHLRNGGMAAMTTHHRIGFQKVDLVRIDLSER